MPSTRSALKRLVDSVADGSSDVDWDAIEAGLSNEDQRDLVRQLRILASLSEVHRSVPDVEDVGGAGNPGTVIGRIDPADAARRETQPASAAQPDPSAWGPLHLLEKVGEGTFGEVYRAFDTQLHREVAVKLLRVSSSQDQLVERVLREGRILARVRNPNVVVLHGAETRDGRVGLWMEYIQGATLERLLRTQGTFSAREAALIGQDLCRAVSAVHAAGLVHRDIKAQNVMREEGGRIVLMDFGAGGLRESASRGPARLTGTPLYLAPEVLSGGESTVRSDIYSLGVLLYHLVTGEYPVRASNLDELRAQHARGKAIRLHDVRPDLPDAFVQVVERATAAPRDDRFGSAGEMMAELKGALAVADRTGSPRAAWSRAVEPIVAWWRRVPRAALVVLAAFVAAISAAVYWLAAAGAPPAGGGVGTVLVGPFASPEPGDVGSTTLARALPVELNARLGTIGRLKIVTADGTGDADGTGVTLADLTRRASADAFIDGVVQLVPAGQGTTVRRVRVSARLCRAGTGEVLWTHSVEGELQDYFDLAGRMAVTMARRLGVVLESREEARLSVRQQVDPAALELYLKGVEAAEERTAEGLESAIGFYRLAAAKDPRFPQAYSGVAAAELLRSNYAGVADTSATYVRATEAADRAIRLAPELADAWATRAFAHYVLGWNWSAAESDFRHAIRLEPQSATAHHWYADYLSAMGRFDESIQEARKALDRTPASVPRARDVAWQYFYARRYDEAVAMLRELAQQHPEAVNVHTLLGRILVLQGQYSDGVHHLERAVALARSATPIGAGGAAPPVFEDGLLAFGYAASGRRADAERILSGAAAVGYRGPMHLCHVAAAFGAMGEFDRAFDALDRAFAARETSAVGLRSDPLFDSLRPDVRFTDLVKRMRFPE